jgi:hypothetical protein
MLFNKSKMYIKTLKTLLRSHDHRQGTYSVCAPTCLYRMIETCRSVLSVLMQILDLLNNIHM